MLVLKIIINDAAHYCVVLSGGALIIAVGLIMCRFSSFFTIVKEVFTLQESKVLITCACLA